VLQLLMADMLASVNGVQLAYSDSGSGSPVVLLVHGFPLNRSMWDPQLGALRSVARVIAPDLRGFGASEHGPNGPLTMDQHADDLAALLSVLEVTEPVVVCGLSMGGYVAFAFWRRHRSRIGALILADTRACADTAEGARGRLAMADEVERLQSAQPAADSFLPRYFSPTLRPCSLPEQLAKGMIMSTVPRTIADGQRGLAARVDSVPDLGSINVPTLVIVGEHDVLTPPSDSELLAERIARSKLVTVPQAGHMANLENPDAFNEALIEFVRSL
jgi:pimeloyl-ACP methyl ester carboxylesterase